MLERSNEPSASFRPRSFVASASGLRPSTRISGIGRSNAISAPVVSMPSLRRLARSIGVAAPDLCETPCDRPLLAVVRGATCRRTAARRQELRAPESQSASPRPSFQEDWPTLVGASRSPLPSVGYRGRRRLRLVLDREPRRLRPSPSLTAIARPPNNASGADALRAPLTGRNVRRHSERREFL